MKVHVRIILLASALAVFVWLGLLSSAQQLPTAKVAPATADDLPLFLNNQQMGSMANSRDLESRLKGLHDKLDLNANAADGGLPNIGKMVFVPDDRLSMARLGSLWSKIDDFFDYPADERMTIWGGKACVESAPTSVKPDLANFVLSNSRFSNEEVEKFKAGEGCLIHTQVIFLDSPTAYSLRLLKSYRTAVSSLEVTDGGTYLFNEQVQDPKLRASPAANLDNPSFRRKVDAAAVKQRAVDTSSLEKEVRAWIKLRAAEGPVGPMSEDDPSVELPIVVAGRASYGSLGPILGLLGNQKVKLTIVVNDTAKGGATMPK